MIPSNPNPPIHWLPGRLRRSLRQALREQVNEAPNHEQDAEQDRNQHDRGRKPFHVPERYIVHSGLGHANIAGPWSSSPSSDLRITSVYGPLVSGLASV